MQYAPDPSHCIGEDVYNGMTQRTGFTIMCSYSNPVDPDVHRGITEADTWTQIPVNSLRQELCSTLILGFSLDFC